MCASLRHRGPDDEGIVTKGSVGLGMRRLSIIDLQGGRQPISNEDGSVTVVFNGEIYNFKTLREELLDKGHRFATASDTEVIVHLYEELGTECSKRLNGMFAFAIWDEKRQTLFLARDHLGIKPLYYAEISGQLVFGSEIKAILLHSQVSREIDLFALDDFLTYRYIPAPRTIFKDIKKLPAGHSLCRTQGTSVVERYWDVDFPKSETCARSEHELASEVRSLLAESVKMQMMSDVPLGAFLSGGIDSSIIVGLMSHHTDQPVKTYSVGFEGWQSYDELKYARIAAQHFGTDHHEIMVEASAIDLLPKLVTFFDEPMADPAAIPTYLMSRVAREDVTVALTGEGADELFAGYGWYAWANPGGMNRIAGRLPSSVRRAALPIVESSFSGRRGKRTLMAALLPTFEERYFETIACSVFQTSERRRLYSSQMNKHLADKAAGDELSYYLEHSQRYQAQSRMQYLDTKIWLADDPLTKVDRMSMAVSLEARVPFLDHRLVELAARIPAHLKTNGKTSKLILRKSMADILPEAILDRQKHAFDVPINEWLRTELRDWIVDLPRHPSIAQTGYFDSAYVSQLVRQHLDGRRSHGAQLWALLNFSLWFTAYECP